MHLRYAVRTAAVILLPLALGGCFWVTTKAVGKTMNRKVDTLEEQMSKQEQALPKLQEVLDQATKLLARNSADIGNQVGGDPEDRGAAVGRGQLGAQGWPLRGRAHRAAPAAGQVPGRRAGR